MEKVTITINGQEITVNNDVTVMHAAEELGFTIPRLCFLKETNETSACRLCVVDVKSMRGLKNSCTLAVQDGMEIETDTDEIHDSVVANLQLLASNHVFECWACEREHNCELLDLMRQYDVDNVYGESNHYYKKHRQLNDTSSSIVLDSGKCVLCGRCVTTCDKEVGLGILNFNERGNETYVGPALFRSMEDSGCISCGKCIEACPVSAIKEKSYIDEVIASLKDPNKEVIVIPDPSTEVTLGEEFGLPIGTNVAGKLYKSFEALGFNEVMSMDYGVDLTIFETAKDLVERIKAQKDFPILASCEPGWVNYVEQYASEFIPNLSTTKTPTQMSGVLAKHVYSEQLGYRKENVVTVAVSPNVSYKDESNKDSMTFQGLKDVDYVITPREYARLLKRKNISLLKLEDGAPFGKLAELTQTNELSGYHSGAALGVLKAASEMLEEPADTLELTKVKGLKGVKEASYRVAGIDVNVAIVENVTTFPDFFKKVKQLKSKYHIIEYRTCSDGYMVDGGQPIQDAKTQDFFDVKKLRLKALLDTFTDKTMRETQLNDKVVKLYEEHLEINHKAMLHTSFEAKTFYNK